MITAFNGAILQDGQLGGLRTKRRRGPNPGATAVRVLRGTNQSAFGNTGTAGSAAFDDERGDRHEADLKQVINCRLGRHRDAFKGGKRDPAGTHVHPMPARMLVRLSSITLRGMTLASKFLLIFFLARFLEPAELGLYGLLVVTVGYALYFLGFDFYAFTTREILSRQREEWGGLLKDQGVLSLLLYGVFLPLFSLIFIRGLLPWNLAGWFFVLVVLEHLTQELSRLLVAISDQLLASALLFLRSGLWGIAVTALMLHEPQARSLVTVLGAWATGGAIALLVGANRIRQLEIAGWNKQIDWHWIGKGLRTAIPLLLATLAIRALFTLDRYWFEALAGLQIVGAYVFFMGMSNALISFLDAGVFSFMYPRLIGAYQQRRPAAFSGVMGQLLVQTICASAAFAVLAMLAIDPLLAWLHKPLYVAQRDLFTWIFLATIIYALSMVPHYGLYAQGRDRPIIQSHVAGLLVFVPATWLISSHSPLLAVPLGLCLAFLVILIWKAWAFIQLTPLEYRLRSGRDTPESEPRNALNVPE